jgi:Fe2+ or Zn2+ uptake regulation protein
LTGSNPRLSLNSVQSVLDTLREHGIQPSAQRIAVAEYVLRTDAARPQTRCSRAMRAPAYR